MTAASYKAARELRGTQVAVAAKLGITQNTLSRREIGEFEVTQEAEVALLSLPKLREKK